LVCAFVVALPWVGPMAEFYQDYQPVLVAADKFVQMAEIRHAFARSNAWRISWLARRRPSRVAVGVVVAARVGLLSISSWDIS
jgi:hypothetical protein